MDAATRLDYAAPYMFVTSQAAAGGKAALLVSKDGSPFQPVDLSYIPLAQVRHRPSLWPVQCSAVQCSAVQCETASGAVRLCTAGSALQGFTVLESTADSVFLRMNDMGDVYASNTNGTEFSLSASAVPCYMHYCDFHQVGATRQPATCNMDWPPGSDATTRKCITPTCNGVTRRSTVARGVQPSLKWHSRRGRDTQAMPS